MMKLFKIVPGAMVYIATGDADFLLETVQLRAGDIVHAERDGFAYDIVCANGDQFSIEAVS